MRAAGAGEPPHGRPAMRRLRRLFGHQRQPGAGRRGRPAGAPRRHRDPVRDARDLRRRAPADAARRHAARSATSWSSASAGGRTTCERNGAAMDNNPSAGNKAGGLTTILEKTLGAIAKGGTTNLVDVYEYAQPVTTQRAGLHGHAGLRPGLGDRPGGRRRQPDLLHHRPRLGLRLRAVAFAQARAPTPRCGRSRKTTWTSTAATCRRHGEHRRNGRAIFRADARDRVGPARPRARCTATGRTSSCRGARRGDVASRATPTSPRGRCPSGPGP